LILLTFSHTNDTAASPGNTRDLEEMMLLGAQRAAADAESGSGDGGLEAAALLGRYGSEVTG
jgi:hypothetical protein